MTIPVFAAVAGGAVLEATTGVVGKMFGRKKKSTGKAGKRTTKKAATKRKTSKKTTSSKGSAFNKTTGRLKKGYRYAKGGRVVKAKK